MEDDKDKACLNVLAPAKLQWGAPAPLWYQEELKREEKIDFGSSLVYCLLSLVISKDQKKKQKHHCSHSIRKRISHKLNAIPFLRFLPSKTSELLVGSLFCAT